MTRQNVIPATAKFSVSENALINALIPLWDMCNHTNGYLSTDYEVDRIECMSCKAFQKGEQILMFYGNRPNAQFLVHNGFVYEDNEHDTYRLRLGISKADKLHDLRRDILKNLGIGESGDFYIHSGPEPIQEHLLAFLRVFNMEKEHLDHWAASDRVRDLMWKDCALDTQIESKVWNFLYNRINLLLGTYSQELEVADPNISEARRMVRTQMVVEKRFLKSTLEYVRQRIKL